MLSLSCFYFYLSFSVPMVTTSLVYYLNHILLWKVVRYEILNCTQCKCQAMYNAGKITFFFLVSWDWSSESFWFFSCFTFRLFVTVLWFKKKQSIQIIFIYINQRTNLLGILMLVSDMKSKIFFSSFVFGLVFYMGVVCLFVFWFWFFIIFCYFIFFLLVSHCFWS